MPTVLSTRSPRSRRAFWSAAGRGRSMCGLSGKQRGDQMACRHQTCSKSCAERWAGTLTVISTFPLHEQLRMQLQGAKVRRKQVGEASAPLCYNGFLSAPLTPGLLQGVPPDLRRQVWMQLSGAHARRQQLQPHYYADAALQGGSSLFAHQIELVRARCVVLSAATSCWQAWRHARPAPHCAEGVGSGPGLCSTTSRACCAGRATDLSQQRLGAERGGAERGPACAARICAPQPAGWLVSGQARPPAAACACQLAIACSQPSFGMRVFLCIRARL